MENNVIPASIPTVYALFYRSGPHERDAHPVIAWLHEGYEQSGPWPDEEPLQSIHWLHGFYVNHAGKVVLCEEDENFDRYSYNSR